MIAIVRGLDRPRGPGRRCLRRPRSVAALWITAVLTAGTPARAQDFAAPAPPWPPRLASAAIEHGLPAASSTPGLEGAVTRWYGLAGLDTRAVAAGLGRGPLRAALGLSQTGEPDIGWTALGASAGLVTSAGAASLRAVVRRDRTTAAGASGDRDLGGEVGAGAWIEARRGLHVWASAPQMWTRGAAPPLSRGLEIGAAAELGAVTLWLSRSTVSGLARDGRGEHGAGLATGAGPLTLWLSARDQPARGGLGVAARRGGLKVAAEIIGHPVLGETARMAVGLGGGR